MTRITAGPRSRRLRGRRPPEPARLADARRHLDRAAEGSRLVLGLLELAFRDGPGDDPGARVDVGLALLEDRAADGDRGVEVAVVAEVADGAAVQPAALALGGRDELHRADLGRARERAGREDRAERVERVELGLEPRLDVRDEVEDVAVALDLHVLADRHGPRPRDAAEVVAPEVDEHHVLGALLGVAPGAPRRAARPRGRWRRAAACRRSGGSSACRPRPGGAAPAMRRRPRRSASGRRTGTGSG